MNTNTITPSNPSRRSRTLAAGVGAIALIGVVALGGCSDDEPSDTTEVEVVTSEVTGTSIVTEGSDVTVGTVVTSEVMVPETTMVTSEVVTTEPGVTTGG